MSGVPVSGVLVALPGIGCDAGQFAPLLAALEFPGAVLALDLPGHHGAPPLPGPVSLDAVVDHVAQRVPAGSVVVGHSTGGIVALELAVRRPDLVSRLVVLDSNVPVTDAAVRAKAARAADVLGPDWNHVLETSMRASWGPREPELRERVVAGIVATPEAALRPLWHDVLALDARPLVAAVGLPALYVRSSRDVDTDVLTALNPRFSAVDLRPLGAGHWPQLVEPVAVADAVREFLG